MTNFNQGGLTFASSFISQATVNASDFVNISAQSAIITGEDGVDYYVSGRDDEFGLRINRADTGAQVFNIDGAQIFADAVSVGVQPPSGWSSGTLGPNIVVAIPETPYFVAFVFTTFGAGVDRGLLWYKINAVGALEPVGGYAGEKNNVDVQFSPQDDRFLGVGFLTAQPFAGANDNLQYTSPLIVNYTRRRTGDNRSVVFVLPSINQILAETPLSEDVPSSPGAWSVKELFLGSTGLGANAFRTEDLPQGQDQNSRTFFLPRSDGKTLLGIMWYTSDLEAYDAGTAAVSNAFLTANAPTYVDGLVTTLEVQATLDSTIFGFTPSLGSVNTSINSVFQTFAGASAFPFADDKTTFAGAPTTAELAYYGNPSVYPSDPEDPDQPWFLFFPKLDRTVRDEVGVRVFEWDPVASTMRQLDFAFGQVYTLGTDVLVNTDPHTVSVNWDRDTGDVTLLMRSLAVGAVNFVVTQFGSFAPIPLTTATGGAPEEFRLRAWAFTLDGHSFYVLRLGQEGTFVYDQLTGQWAQWLTGTNDNWDAVYGGNWNGMVVSGALEEPYLWEVDPDGTLDNAGAVDGDIPITRTVTGLVSIRGHERTPVGSVELTASAGATQTPSATISLRYSDDYGNTFSSPISFSLSATDTGQEIEWRSLGSMRAPGRLFEITDIGGVVRIDDAIIE